MTDLVLWLLDRLRFLFRTLGADYEQLRAIVQVKLMMDNRRSFVSLGRYGKQSAETNNNFIRIIGLYTLFGGLLSFSFLARPYQNQLFLPLTLQFGYIMILCAMTLISDFSSVILDSSDNQIILPRPVSNRTLWLARVVHISSYLFAIALSLSVIAILIIGYRFGAIAGLFMLALSLSSAVLMVFLTNVFYLGLMQFISEEKLREIINYFQIVMAILFYGGYQLLPRLVASQGDLTQTFDHQWWHYLVPPMWMAGAVDLFIQPVFDSVHFVFLALAILAPLAGLWFMNRFLTAGFTQKLSSLDQESRLDMTTTNQHTSTDKINWVERFAGWATNSSVEQVAFAFTWRITGRDRKFKLKTYPQLGFGFAYVLIMSLQKGSFTSGSYFYLFTLYFSGLYLMVAQYQLSVSDNYRAAWVYGSAPIQTPGQVLAGATKALIVKLFIPFYILLSAYIIYRYGVNKIGDVLLAFGNSLIMLTTSSLLSTRYMPFSIQQDAIKQNNTARGIMISILLGLVGFAHYGLTFIPYGVWIAIPFSFLIVDRLLRRYRKTDWDAIEMA